MKTINKPANVCSKVNGTGAKILNNYAQSHKNKFTDLIFARDGCYC